MGYREDNRTLEQFKKDIAEGSKAERDIINRYKKHCEAFGLMVEIIDNGCDNSGEYLNIERVSTKADFVVNGKPLEVKFNKRCLRIFHIKKNQLLSYIQQNCYILWVNGYETPYPQFTLIRAGKMYEISQKQKKGFDVWGGKECMELDSQEFNWKPLPKGDYDGKEKTNK